MYCLRDSLSTFICTTFIPIDHDTIHTDMYTHIMCTILKTNILRNLRINKLTLYFDSAFIKIWLMYSLTIQTCSWWMPIVSTFNLLVKKQIFMKSKGLCEVYLHLKSIYRWHIEYTNFSIKRDGDWERGGGSIVQIQIYWGNFISTN